MPAAPKPPPAPTTSGYLLGGRVRYRQPSAGHRSGIEPILLAAALPANPGARVLEAGTGAGAGLLCLAARVSGMIGVGLEIDPTMARIAAGNFALAADGALHAVVGDLRQLPAASSSFDHAMANPPWHEPSGTVSPDAARNLARRATGDLLTVWVEALAGVLRPGGTLLMIASTTTLPTLLGAYQRHGLGGAGLLPLWPREGVKAKLALLHAVRGGRSPFRLLPGLTLHRPDGSFTPAAEAILRAGAALPIA